MSDPCIAVLGLGEAGSTISRDLIAAGVSVRGYDPLAAALWIPAGVSTFDSEAEAVATADLVLSLNSADAAMTALTNGLPGLAPDAIWADLNTSAAQLKRDLAATVTAAGAGRCFADVAMLAPVPGRGIRTPMLASGAGGPGYAALMTPLGAQVDVLAEEPGAAATRKLLRSVFFKGLAASVVEALTAARAVGLEDWLRENIAEELARSDPETVDRLERGSLQHARRRAHEMAAATELLAELGVPARIAAASRDLLIELSQRPPSPLTTSLRTGLTGAPTTP